MDSSYAAFSIEPVSLHYKPGEDRHYLVIINEGETPFIWLITDEPDWISSSNMTGILASKELEAAFIDIDRELINESWVQDTINITVLSTGESRPVPIYVEK
jgi:hypothetical protein